MTAPEGMAAMERIQAIGAAAVLVGWLAVLLAKPWLMPRIRRIYSIERGCASCAKSH